MEARRAHTELQQNPHRMVSDVQHDQQKYALLRQSKKQNQRYCHLTQALYLM